MELNTINDAIFAQGVLFGLILGIMVTAFLAALFFPTILSRSFIKFNKSLAPPEVNYEDYEEYDPSDAWKPEGWNLHRYYEEDDETN